MKYKYRKGVHVPATIPASIAADELERIRQKHGRLTSELVVNESRKQSAPLHSYFEWDDRKAAEAYRRKQAGTLIRAVVVEHQYEDLEVPKFIMASIEDDRSYYPTEVVVQNVDLFEDAKHRLESQLKNALKSLEDLTRYAAQSGSDAQVKRVTKAASLLERAKMAVSRI